MKRYFNKTLLITSFLILFSNYLIFFKTIFKHFERRILLSLSPIILILDSVPDFLTKILPRPLINLSAILIDFLTD